MVRVYVDSDGKSFVVKTTCLTVEEFVFDLSTAIAVSVKNAGADAASVMYGVMEQAMPIAFKLAGYKADNVREERTLVAGHVSPDHCKVIGSSDE